MSSEFAQAAPDRIVTATPSSVRAVNRAILLELIRTRQPISRADLARMTGIFRSSVSDIVDELIASNLVREERGVASRRGRVPMNLTLNEDGQQVLGLNIRPRFSQLAFAGLSGRVQKTWTFETPEDPEQLVRSVAHTLDRVRRELRSRGKIRFERAGIAIPGHVDVHSGRILWTPTHAELAGFPITVEVERQTGIPALADNDCNAGALSELWLAGERKAEDRNTDFIFLNLSDYGTGAGAVVNGEIYLGHDSHYAAEFGHMVVEPNGILCRCGRRGCWERYVSNFATWERYKPRTPFTPERFMQMLASARKGDRCAVAAVMETARYLSLGLSNIAFAFNPSEVVVAGRITAVWDLIRDTVERAYGSPQLRYTVRPARLSADDSLLHGAVCLALRETFAPPRFGRA